MNQEVKIMSKGRKAMRKKQKENEKNLVE